MSNDFVREDQCSEMIPNHWVVAFNSLTQPGPHLAHIAISGMEGLHPKESCLFHVLMIQAVIDVLSCLKFHFFSLLGEGSAFGGPQVCGQVYCCNSPLTNVGALGCVCCVSMCVV